VAKAARAGAKRVFLRLISFIVASAGNFSDDFAWFVSLWPDAVAESVWARGVEVR